MCYSINLDPASELFSMTIPKDNCGATDIAVYREHLDAPNNSRATLTIWFTPCDPYSNEEPMLFHAQSACFQKAEIKKFSSLAKAMDQIRIYRTALRIEFGYKPISGEGTNLYLDEYF